MTTEHLEHTETQPYDMWFCFPVGYAPPEQQPSYQGTFSRTVTFAENFSPSVATVIENPTSNVEVTFTKNGTLVLTVTVSVDGEVTFSGPATTFNRGDVLRVFAPASLRGLSLTLGGIR